MPELPSEARGALGTGLSKERMMLPHTTKRPCFTGGTPRLIFDLCCLKIMVAGNLKMAICVCFYIVRKYLIEGIFTSKLSAWGGTEILFNELELQRAT